MFELDKQMERWRSELRASHRYLSSDIDELEAHLLDQMEDLKEKGLTEEEAFLVAAHRVGDVDSLSKEFSRLTRRSKIRRPLVLSGVAALVLIVELIIWWNVKDGSRIEIGLPTTGQEIITQAIEFFAEERGLDMERSGMYLGMGRSSSR